MGKGSKPRNCFSSEYRDNYDDIDWGKSNIDRELVEDCPIFFRQEDRPQSTIEGMIRQTLDIPLEKDDDCGCSENNCCANE